MFTTLELPGMRRAVAGGQKDARDPLIPPDLPKKILSRYTAKSRLGCLTCKARKKKCDETRPVCRDCLRFNKECVWVDQSMSGSEIRRLRKEVQEKAKESKLRRRRSKKAKLEEVEGASVFLLEGMEKGHEKNRGKNHESKNLENKSLENTILENKSPENNILENNILVNVILRQNMFTVPDITPLGQEYTQPVGFPDLGRGNSSAMASTEFLPLPKAGASPLFLAHKDVSPPPLDVDSFRFLPEAESPTPFLTFLKDLTLLHEKDSTGRRNNAMSEKSSVYSDGRNEEPENGQVSVSPETALARMSPNFSVPEFLENIHLLRQRSPAELNNLASNFNAAFLPRPQAHLSFLPGLDDLGQFLYNYYVNTLSAKVSIAPTSQDESNSYQKVFLPLAQKDDGVLYGILAWAGFHLGGKWLSEGSKYAEKAVKLLTQGVDFGGLACVENDRRTILNKLATILILCGAEICRGDVKYWSVYLNWGWKLLRDNGGILKFDNNKEEHWLISNFAYHDLLASSTSERGTYFPIDTYNTIFADPEGVSRGLLNPLLGVSKSLFKVIGEINSLAYESKRSLDIYYNRGSPKSSDLWSTPNNVAQSPDLPMQSSFGDTDSEISEHAKTGRLLCSILERAQKLKQDIETAKPEMADIVNLSDSDLELQLTSFEAFQLSCTLFLRQSIMKCNPSSLESQILVNDLVKCLDILLDSPMVATLVFPIFMAGIHLVTEDDREAMRIRIDKMMATYGPWNVVRVKFLVEKVWEENPDGDKVVDWHAILKSLGWDLNFA